MLSVEALLHSSYGHHADINTSFVLFLTRKKLYGVSGQVCKSVEKKADSDALYAALFSLLERLCLGRNVRPLAIFLLLSNKDVKQN